MELYNMGLLEELAEVGKNHHAEHVYHKCIRAKKHKLAAKIAKKYGINTTPSDRVVAMGVALLANKKHNR